MDRVTKENIRRAAAARTGLSADAISALDEREAATAVLVAKAQQFHVRLFPEEYDEVYDDQVDAALRARGINPMSPTYIKCANDRRRELGFEPYKVGATGTLTLEWTQELIERGNVAVLEDLCAQYGF